MASKQVRFVKAFIMHGRTPDGLLDYVDFFDWVVGLPPASNLVLVRRDLAFAIERTVQRAPLVHFRFASGDPTGTPLLYDEQTGTTTVASTPRGTWLASNTRVSVSPQHRLLLVESRRVGVSAVNLERYFQLLAEQQGYVDALHLDLSPVASPSFEAELDDMARIREAALVVGRPNSDWDDSNNLLSKLAEQSKGAKAEIGVTAGRGDSLKKEGGIVGLIREHLRQPLPNLRNLRVVGRRLGEAVDRTLSLDRHQLRRTARIDPEASQVDQDDAAFAASEELAATAMPLIEQRAAEEPSLDH